MEVMHYCGTELHDGAMVPATWMVRQAVAVEGAAADQSLSAALVPSAGESTVFCACDEHVALNLFGTGKFIVRRVATP